MPGGSDSSHCDAIRAASRRHIEGHHRRVVEFPLTSPRHLRVGGDRRRAVIRGHRHAGRPAVRECRRAQHARRCQRYRAGVKRRTCRRQRAVQRVVNHRARRGSRKWSHSPAHSRRWLARMWVWPLVAGESETLHLMRLAVMTRFVPVGFTSTHSVHAPRRFRGINPRQTQWPDSSNPVHSSRRTAPTSPTLLLAHSCRRT